MGNKNIEIFFDEKGGKIRKPLNVKPKWRISGYALIVVNGKILTVRTSRSNNIELPGGGIGINESIEEGIRRECYEETGYKIRVNDEPIHVGERNFYCTELNEYFKSVILVYPGNLIDERQNIEVVNTVEKNEITKIEWTNVKELYEADVHPIVWPAIKKILRIQK
jgi:8-oxo-dGTP pyrophosphatase MutT (NUDIX family)